LDNRRGDLRDFAVVAVLIFAVLSLLLRALLAPLLLLATTALSLLSALGATVLTWVVVGGQAGTNNHVLLYSLIFLAALGVDYNILLASRIREEMATHGFAEGVRVALTRTGGVITSPGLILAGTFAVLMTQPLNSLLQFGFAMAARDLLIEEGFTARSFAHSPPVPDWRDRLSTPTSDPETTSWSRYRGERPFVTRSQPSFERNCGSPGNVATG
jgi:uncharacterized membrane protein YdfJ with MMPL/SSD domain